MAEPTADVKDVHDVGPESLGVPLTEAGGAGAAPTDLHQAAPGTPAETSPQDNLVIGVAVVQFHHQIGPQVEHTFPPDLMKDQDLMADLPFFALPDGSHLVRFLQLFEPVAPAVAC